MHSGTSLHVVPGKMSIRPYQTVNVMIETRFLWSHVSVNIPQCSVLYCTSHNTPE